ncbi:hypothetical protein Hanom_Chr11g01004891 [Helianthus anomalus]
MRYSYNCSYSALNALLFVDIFFLKITFFVSRLSNMVHEWQISLLWVESVYVMLLVPFLQRKKVHDVIAGLINTYFQMFYI